MANHTHVNKWGYEGWNCKWRPAGSGTTHANRREFRQHLQWENLVQKEPDTAQKDGGPPGSFGKGYKKKAQEKLEELKKKPLEKGKQDVEESCSSGSKRKHTKAKTSSSYSYESTTSTSSSQGLRSHL